MSIYVTGDIHGYPIRFEQSKLEAMGLKLTENDKVIICGDFGLPWYRDAEEECCLDWLEAKPFEILFVDGNHENFDLLNALPVEERYGGKVRKLRNNVFHLMRGEVYEIEGKTFFTFGGATSVDKHMREEQVDWWQEEVFCEAERLNAIRHLERTGNEVDCVITHTVPRRFLANLSVNLQNADTCPVSEFLDELSCKIKCEKWYFGHFHTDAQINEKFTCVYENVEEIE
jgi:predicted phosphodiesterase